MRKFFLLFEPFCQTNSHSELKLHVVPEDQPKHLRALLTENDSLTHLFNKCRSNISLALVNIGFNFLKAFAQF